MSHDYQRLRVEVDDELDGLLTITLDRPDKLNALDIATHDELQDLCASLETDPTVRVVVLTGAGVGPSPPARSLATAARPHR